MTTARDIMHSGAECIGENDTLLTAARMMRDLDVGSLPICGDDDRLHGIITDRDIVLRCCAEGRDPAQVRASEMAQGTPHWIDARSDVGEVLASMEEHRIRRMPVISDHRLVGMISEADLAQHLDGNQLAHFVETICAGK
ncbi:CBS domain-containing protein [Saccharopolyspora sp. TS4A08]|uniref:CBS domain-containing protein n=1 Tax=Saccharopolyspora ipomoeae TaxID=3042027 RepID=A0ABT6PW11_9PSEU|nr:CBS domain-containing protein [Saccharopolyspora sp. TS4A08]MDI2032206.1 CBS domain-containing protein [Saccharopolyspora sp. TS4A08]